MNDTAHPSAGRRFWQWPVTRLGQWAAVLAAVFVILFLLNAFVFMPLNTDAPWQRILLILYGFAMLACGLASGITGLIAVVRQRERSLWVGLPFLLGLFVLFLILGEFLVPH